MFLKRDEYINKMYLIEDNRVVMETGRIGGEFVLSLYTDNPIIVTEEVDKYLYLNLKELFQNNYFFTSNGLSYKRDNKIVWFSDQYCDLEEKEQTDRINRLILEQVDNQIIISYTNPFFERNGIKRRENLIAFSPCGNGFYSRNIDTGLSFQDDVSILFLNTLMYKCEQIKVKKKQIKKEFI